MANAITKTVVVPHVIYGAENLNKQQVTVNYDTQNQDFTVVAAPGTDKHVVVVGVQFVPNGAATLQIKDSSSVVREYNLAAKSGIDYAFYLFGAIREAAVVCPAGEPLVINCTSTGTFNILYFVTRGSTT